MLKIGHGQVSVVGRKRSLVEEMEDWSGLELRVIEVLLFTSEQLELAAALCLGALPSHTLLFC